MVSDYRSVAATEDDEKTADVHHTEAASTSHPLMEEPKWLGAQVRMLACVFGGVAAAVAHDRFYTYLAGKPADGNLFRTIRDHTFSITDQALVNFVSNLITKAAVTCFSAAIGTAFAQLFWWKLYMKSTTIRKIDGLMDFKSQPWNVFSWKEAFSFRMLALVAVCVTIIQIGSALLPGSLTIDYAFSPLPCTVATVDLSHADLADTSDINAVTGLPTYYIANGRASAHAGRVFVAGTTFYPESTCGICTYNVTFTAPAVRCNNITQEPGVNVSALLGSWPASDEMSVWYAYPDGEDAMTIASRNLLTDPQGNVLPADQLPTVVLSCTGWNATYTAEISQDTTTTMAVSVNIENQITCEDLCNSNDTTAQQLLGLWDALAGQLNGTVDYFTSTNEFALFASLAAWSPIGRGSSTGLAWQWSDDLATLIPEIMQNISLSLLAGDLDDSEYTTTKNISTTCQVKGLQFHYASGRLRATYGAALGIVAVCIGCGLMAYLANDHHETLNFSRILASVPEKKTVSESLTLDTAVRARKDGRLILADQTTRSKA